MRVVIPFILDVRFVDVPAGVTQEEGHTGFLHLPFAVLAVIFLVRRILPFLSLVDRAVKRISPKEYVWLLHICYSRVWIKRMRLPILPVVS